MGIFVRNQLPSVILGFLAGVLGFWSAQLTVDARSTAKIVRAEQVEIVGSHGETLITLGSSETGPFIKMQDRKKQKQINLFIFSHSENQIPFQELNFTEVASNTRQACLVSLDSHTSFGLNGPGKDTMPGPVSLRATTSEGDQPAGQLFLGDLGGNRIWLRSDDNKAELTMNRTDRAELHLVTPKAKGTPQIMRKSAQGIEYYSPLQVQSSQ